MFHLRLIKALSYTGVVHATKKNPDVFTEDKAIADTAVASGYFSVVEDEEQEAQQETVSAHLSKEQLEEMKFDELKKLAAEMGIETKGLTKKVELVEAIAAVEVEVGPETDEDGNEVDYGEGSPTMTELQEQ